MLFRGCSCSVSVLELLNGLSSHRGSRCLVSICGLEGDLNGGLEQVQTWAERSCLNDKVRQRKVDMIEILTHGTFVKVRPLTHSLENKGEGVDEEQRRVSALVVNVPVNSNGQQRCHSWHDDLFVVSMIFIVN